MTDDYVARLEGCKRAAVDGSEYWMARDLLPLLGYSTWERFDSVILRAHQACASAGVDPVHQFHKTANVITAGKGAQLERADWFLSRYACYLIAINSDPIKPEVGAAQTYFAVQARRQEVQDQLTDVQRRALLRDRVTDANKKLMDAAKRANVQKYAVFHDAGYKGLYGGLGVGDIKRRKGIADGDQLLDCAGRVELAMNEFKTTQAEAKIVREKINTEAAAIRAHGDVGAEVRKAVEKMGGIMPEDLPAEPNINKLISLKERKALKSSNSGLVIR
jgi:DNA-damage-inducible protein D